MKINNIHNQNNQNIVEKVNTDTNDTIANDDTANDTSSWFMRLFENFGCWIYVACAAIIGILCFVVLYFRRKWSSK